jgi:hypothetical protein
MLFSRIATSQTKWQCAHAKGSDKQRSTSSYSARSTPTSVTACTQPQAPKTTRKCSQHHAERKRPHIGSNAQGSSHSLTSDYSGKDRRQVTARNSSQRKKAKGKGKEWSLVILRRKTRLLGITQNNRLARAYRFSSPEGFSCTLILRYSLMS